MKDKFYAYIQQLQDAITSKLEEVDGKATFQEDIWKRPEGGGGRTRVIENGAVFEKGGVNISGVRGELPDSMKTYFNVKEGNFFACGLSLVLHPKNPMVPTVHANWRYFELYGNDGEIVDQWFGGGQDLTPYYLFDEDAITYAKQPATNTTLLFTILIKNVATNISGTPIVMKRVVLADYFLITAKDHQK